MANMIEIDYKYGGRPKKDQLVREGHYPKFSEMIDSIEKIAIQYIGFENYLQITKNQTLQDRKDMEDVLSGRKKLEDFEYFSESMSTLPLASNNLKRSPSDGSSHTMGEY